LPGGAAFDPGEHTEGTLFGTEDEIGHSEGRPVELQRPVDDTVGRLPDGRTRQCSIVAAGTVVSGHALGLVQPPMGEQSGVGDLLAPIGHQGLQIYGIYDAIAEEGRGNIKQRIVLAPVFNEKYEVIYVDFPVAGEVTCDRHADLADADWNEVRAIRLAEQLDGPRTGAMAGPGLLYAQVPELLNDVLHLRVRHGHEMESTHDQVHLFAEHVLRFTDDLNDTRMGTACNDNEALGRVQHQRLLDDRGAQRPGQVDTLADLKRFLRDHDSRAARFYSLNQS